MTDAERNRLERDWAVILQSEWAALAVDREVQEGLLHAAATLARQAAALPAAPDDPSGPARPDAPPGATALDAAPDAAGGPPPPGPCAEPAGRPSGLG